MKLCILDKDGTLTTPISGGKFPQDPTDQKLLPGVKDSIDRLRADGWTLAIASNQGGCDWFEISVINLKVGQRFQVMDSDEGENFFSGDVFTVESIGSSGSDICVETGSQDFDFATNDRVLIQYKTIESAIEEVQFAADLCGIDQAYFCPDMAGGRCFDLSKTTDPRFEYGITEYAEWKSGAVTPSSVMEASFRKPGPGMLIWADLWAYQEGNVIDRIMIGDRPEDREAAEAAGIRFLDAEEWRSGASVEVKP